VSPRQQPVKQLREQIEARAAGASSPIAGSLRQRFGSADLDAASSGDSLPGAAAGAGPRLESGLEPPPTAGKVPKPSAALVASLAPPEDEPVEETLADAAAAADTSGGSAGSGAGSGRAPRLAALSTDAAWAAAGGDGAWRAQATALDAALPQPAAGSAAEAAAAAPAESEAAAASDGSRPSVEPSPHRRLHAACAHLSKTADAGDVQLSVGRQLSGQSAAAFGVPQGGERGGSQGAGPDASKPTDQTEITAARDAAASPRDAGLEAEDWGSHPRSRLGSVASLAGATAQRPRFWCVTTPKLKGAKVFMQCRQLSVGAILTHRPQATDRTGCRSVQITRSEAARFHVCFCMSTAGSRSSGHAMQLYWHGGRC